MKKDYFTKRARYLFVLIIFLSGLIPLSSWATPLVYYRSATSGNWSDAATWETSPDGLYSWSAAVSAPSSSSDVSIEPGHTVTLTSAQTISYLNLLNGGVLNVDKYTLTVNGGTNTLLGTVQIKLYNSSTYGSIVLPNSNISLYYLTAQVTTENGFSPTGAALFTIISASSITNQFNTLDFPAATGWNASYGATTVTINRTMSYYRSYSSGAWSDPDNWDYSTNGTSWSPSSDFPHNGNADSIIVKTGNSMVLSSSYSIGSLFLQSGATIDLGSNELTLTKNAKLEGAISSNIASVSSYGDLLSNTKSVDISNLSITVNASYTPSGNATFSIVKVASSPLTIIGTPSSISLPSGGFWSSASTTTALNVSYGEPKNLYRSAQSGEWKTLSTWEYSTDGSSWNAASNYPRSSGTDSIIIQSGHTVTLNNYDITAKNLNLVSDATIDIANNELTLSGKATLLGTIALHINSETIHGTINSNYSGIQPVSNLKFIVTSEASYTPTSVVNFNIISSSIGSIDASPELTTMTLPWDLGNWSDGFGSQIYTITYNGTITQINETKSNGAAFASNGKLTYYGGTVYDVFGTKVASANAKEVVTLQPGVYFVKSGNRVQKVLVK